LNISTPATWRWNLDLFQEGTNCSCLKEQSEIFEIENCAKGICVSLLCPKSFQQEESFNSVTNMRLRWNWMVGFCWCCHHLISSKRSDRNRRKSEFQLPVNTYWHWWIGLQIKWSLLEDLSNSHCRVLHRL